MGLWTYSCIEVEAAELKLSYRNSVLNSQVACYGTMKVKVMFELLTQNASIKFEELKNLDSKTDHVKHS